MIVIIFLDSVAAAPAVKTGEVFSGKQLKTHWHHRYISVIFFFFPINLTFFAEDWSTQPATEDWSNAPTAQASDWGGAASDWS